MFYQTKEFSGAHITQSITIDVPAQQHAQLVTAVARASARPSAQSGGGMRLSLSSQNGGLPYSSDAIALGADGLVAASSTRLVKADAGFGTSLTVRLSPIGGGIEPATIDLQLVVAAQDYSA